MIISLYVLARNSVVQSTSMTTMQQDTAEMTCILLLPTFKFVQSSSTTRPGSSTLQAALRTEALPCSSELHKECMNCPRCGVQFPSPGSPNSSWRSRAAKVDPNLICLAAKRTSLDRLSIATCRRDRSKYVRCKNDLVRQTRITSGSDNVKCRERATCSLVWIASCLVVLFRLSQA